MSKKKVVGATLNRKKYIHNLYEKGEGMLGKPQRSEGVLGNQGRGHGEQRRLGGMGRSMSRRGKKYCSHDRE